MCNVFIELLQRVSKAMLIFVYEAFLSQSLYASTFGAGSVSFVELNIPSDGSIEEGKRFGANSSVFLIFFRLNFCGLIRFGRAYCTAFAL
jgi:hypothetical protein